MLALRHRGCKIRTNLGYTEKPGLKRRWVDNREMAS